MNRQVYDLIADLEMIIICSAPPAGHVILNAISVNTESENAAVRDTITANQIKSDAKYSIMDQ